MLGNLIPFFFSGNSLQEYIAYYNRVLGDGGTLVDPVGTQSILKMLKDNARLDNVKLLWYGGAGVKKVISGINTNVSKAYSIQLPSNDLTQTTALSQPWQSGNIAPNEKPCLLNPSGGSRFLSHPSISFGVTEAWSVSVLLNSNATLTASSNDFAGKAGTTRLGILQSTNKILFQNESGNSGTEVISAITINGKNKLLTFVAQGNGTLLVYIDGVYAGLLTVATNAVFERLLHGRSLYFFGKIYYYAIQSGALTPSQVAAEYNTLRALIPERESVVIGSQAWTTSNLDIVCDAQGVVIPEVTNNTNEEKYTGFTAVGSGWINNGDGTFTATGSGSGAQLELRQAYTWLSGRRYRIRVTVTGRTTGNLYAPYDGFTPSSIINTNTSIDIEYTPSSNNGTNMYIVAGGGFNGTVSAISVELIGWAALTTPAWCHYNNDSANGAIYGKLYNWYAVKQIDDALAATGSEWRVPTQAQFETLATTLGGASVAGGKMKVAGTIYFGSPNTGATNESGFTALGVGYRRFDTGAFIQLTGACIIHSITTDGTFCSQLSVDNGSSASVINAFGRLKQGSSIRLVKNL